MPKTKGNFWSEYEVTVDFNGKEKYKCKTCSRTWSKNASCLKEYIEKCKDMNVETIRLFNLIPLFPKAKSNFFRYK
ncbi:hypothetical protein RhiirB3_434339 [Rhizophagus irregularis]|nr:hypothetical protein RhiirB3_434339 [Rhizophagus irregularis]